MIIIQYIILKTPKSRALSTPLDMVTTKARLEMGMFRDSGSQEIDIVKEMVEGLGSQGLKLEDLLEKPARPANECRRWCDVTRASRPVARLPTSRHQ
jgi:hypothetical protein